MGDYFAGLETEWSNENTRHIDECNTLEILRLINQEDAMVADRVKAALPQIALAVDAIFARMKEGGHLIYVGAGTSGRLGILDAAECIPTYGVEPELVQGHIAGGDSALRFPIEGCEDNETLGKQTIQDCSVTEKDVVVGISASGSANFVIGALQEARDRGACTVVIVNNHGSKVKEKADICIEVLTGPEVVSGSTRMKAGTSQKMVLNMISTATMIKKGKVYGNLMVDVKATNQKLKARAKRIFSTATGLSEEAAEKYLELAGMDTKLAIMMGLSGYDKEHALQKLAECDGFLGKALKEAGKQVEAKV